jgi:hypothetical protein
MNDLELIAAFAPESGPDPETRRRAWARLDERIAGQRGAAVPARRDPRARRRLIGASAAAALAAAAAAAVVLTVGGPAGPGAEDAHAAVAEAARATAASARSSGTAVVRMTHDGSPWAGSTLRWHGADLDLSHDHPQRPGEAASGLRVVGGALYGRDPRGGGWVEMGRAESIDPGSGTTPAEYLAAVEEDVSGATLRRISAGVQDLVTRPGEGGSTVYSGTVAAGLVARQSAVKGGRPIRVLPFGYVAHDEAADPGAPLRIDLTVGGNGLVRRIAVAWGPAGSRWTYAVDYAGLGALAPIVAPVGAAPLRR